MILLQMNPFVGNTSCNPRMATFAHQLKQVATKYCFCSGSMGGVACEMVGACLPSHNLQRRSINGTMGRPYSAAKVLRYLRYQPGGVVVQLGRVSYPCTALHMRLLQDFPSLLLISIKPHKIIMVIIGLSTSSAIVHEE